MRAMKCEIQRSYKRKAKQPSVCISYIHDRMTIYECVVNECAFFFHGTSISPLDKLPYLV